MQGLQSKKLFEKLTKKKPEKKNELIQPSPPSACALGALSPGLMALCSPISLTPSPRRRNEVGGFGSLQPPFRLRRRSTSSSSPCDGDGNGVGDGGNNGSPSSSSFFFAAATAAEMALFPGDAGDGLALDHHPCWGEQRSETTTTALAGELPTAAAAAAAAALPLVAPAALQLLQAPPSLHHSSSFSASAFDPASALRASSFAAERLRLTPAEGDSGGGVGGGSDWSRQRPEEGRQVPFPSSLPGHLPAPPPPLLSQQQGKQSDEQQERPRKRASSKKGIVVAVPTTRVLAAEDDGSGSGDESVDDDDGESESDDDDEDGYGDDEQAAAMDAEAAHFVRRSSGVGGDGNGNGNGNGSRNESNPSAASAAAAAAAMAEAARLEEAATVLSASLGAQHPQVGKAWLLVARAHGAGSGGGGGSGIGGGGERALTKCVRCFFLF